jgi:hypothetical protein
MKPWSFSSLNLYETCPRQYDLTKNKRVIPYTETEATKWGSAVHGALESYMTAPDEVPLTDPLSGFQKYADRVLALGGTLFIERKVALTRNLTPTDFEDENAWCRGILDVCVVSGEKAFVADWKTGKIRPGSDQLRLFAGFVMQLHPEVEQVKTAYIWLNHGKATTEIYRRTDLPGIWNHFMTKVARLESSYTRDRWVPKPSGLCRGYCRAGKDHCEFWSELNAY